MCDDHEKYVRLGCLALPARQAGLAKFELRSDGFPTPINSPIARWRETVGRRGAGKCPQERRNQKSTIIFSRWW